GFASQKPTVLSLNVRGNAKPFRSRASSFPPCFPASPGATIPPPMVCTFRGPVRSRITKVVTMNVAWLGYERLRLWAQQNIDCSKYRRLEATRLCELGEMLWPTVRLAVHLLIV